MDLLPSFLQQAFEHGKDAFYALQSLPCCGTDATLKLNGRTYRIEKLLGEGGFSYVYLAQDTESGRMFALKKISCPLGNEGVRGALGEVEAYKRFRHPNIIRCLDSCVVQDKEGEGKVVYVFLPYYQNGSVQQIIASNVVNGTHYPELTMLKLFLSTCHAVRALHTYSGSSSTPKGSRPLYPPTSSSISSNPSSHQIDDHDEEDEDAGGPTRGESEGEALIGSTESARSELMEEEQENGGEGQGKGKGEQSSSSFPAVPWAHRDIKPANILIADDHQTPILMDFGSALPARIEVPTRNVALEQQDLAAEMCSMPFRAPELFDVKTGVPLTEAVDIWSLGCTLYAMAFNTSPFETTQQSEFGGSIAMAVLGGKYSFPNESAGGGKYSEGFQELIKGMLKVKVEERWDIHQVIGFTEKTLERLR